MRPIQRFFYTAFCTFALLVWSGCGLQEELACCGHDHSHDDRDAPVPDPKSQLGTDDREDGHTHIGPNGGRLIVLGDEDYHAELVIDHTKGEVTVCILDQTGRNPVGVDQRTVLLNFKCQGQPYQLELTAVDCPDGTQGNPSCFIGSSEVLRGDCHLTGRLNVMIAGKPYTGRVAHRREDHALIR
jgi:hypothetical protein